jgi:putative intracellular protease/amidase
MNVLIVLTSHDKLGDSGRKTGFWLEEFVVPYYHLKDAGVHLTLASPKGGQPPIDPKSHEPDAQGDATRRFLDDQTAQKELAHTAKLSEMKAEDFDAIFYPGGHGPLWDLYSDQDSIALIEAFIASGKPVATVCHAPAVLLKAKAPNHTPLLKGKKVTGFSNDEEAAVGLTKVVPYLLQDELVAIGANYQKVDNWKPFAIVDGLIITGQNPASSELVAKALLKALDN